MVDANTFSWGGFVAFVVVSEGVSRGRPHSGLGRDADRGRKRLGKGTDRWTGQGWSGMVIKTEGDGDEKGGERKGTR